MARKKKIEDFSFRPFRNLGDIITSGSIRTDTPGKNIGFEIIADDEQLFRAEMRDVREIEEYRKIPVRRRGISHMNRLVHPDEEAARVLSEISSGKRPIKLEDTQEYVEWTNLKAGYTSAVAKKLHEGRFAIQDYIDLHGYTVDEAEAKISDFLRSSVNSGLRCVKIIHGRGLKSPKGPVLKISLVKWLSGKYRKNVVAFSTARRCDGGLGAVYVLLREYRINKKLS
ncbi:MAG TPA: Smr/MutS family protein [Dissulfurispiraceae bacterium]|nr:Smr/MutS family protein [Dissulfurispiraceae bacterium]